MPNTSNPAHRPGTPMTEDKKHAPGHKPEDKAHENRTGAGGHAQPEHKSHEKDQPAHGKTGGHGGGQR